MTIPNFQDVMLPVLREAADGSPRPWRQLRDACITEFNATEDELAERLPSGGSRFDSRVQWAITHLVQAGVLARPKRGQVCVTERGKEVLVDPPTRITMHYLSRFAEYQEFRSRTRSTGPSSTPAHTEEEGGTPTEAIATAVGESTDALHTELLQRLVTQPPSIPGAPRAHPAHRDGLRRSGGRRRAPRTLR